MNDYSIAGYEPPDFPALSQLSDGKWQQIWALQLSEDQTSEQNLRSIEQELSNGEIVVKLLKRGRTIYVEVTTIRWQLDDDLIIWTFNMFEILNTKIHGIESIQGQEKKKWVRSLRRK
jgi:hypothetical protein